MTTRHLLPVVNLAMTVGGPSLVGPALGPDGYRAGRSQGLPPPVGRDSGAPAPLALSTSLTGSSWAAWSLNRRTQTCEDVACRVSDTAGTPVGRRLPRGCVTVQGPPVARAELELGHSRPRGRPSQDWGQGSEGRAGPAQGAMGRGQSCPHLAPCTPPPALPQAVSSSGLRPTLPEPGGRGGAQTLGGDRAPGRGPRACGGVDQRRPECWGWGRYTGTSPRGGLLTQKEGTPALLSGPSWTPTGGPLSWAPPGDLMQTLPDHARLPGPN